MADVIPLPTAAVQPIRQIRWRARRLRIITTIDQARVRRIEREQAEAKAAAEAQSRAAEMFVDFAGLARAGQLVGMSARLLDNKGQEWLVKFGPYGTTSATDRADHDES